MGIRISNYYIGAEEYGIFLNCGEYQVRSEWNNWGIVFSGSYNECKRFLDEEWLAARHF